MAAADTASAGFSVDGKTAIVTGAGSGINYCFAKLLLSRNCNVVFADLSLRPEAQKLVDEYSKKDGGKPRAVFVKTDVVKWDDLSAMFDVAEKEFGGADVVRVCPGAGIYEPHWTNFWHPPGTSASRDAVHGTEKEGLGHYAVFDINLTHPIRTTQLAISHWLNPPQGREKVSPSNPKRVVHISSIAGQIASPGTPLYCASKHAISGFIRGLGPLEAQTGIRVNGVAPGVIKTPLWTDHPEKIKQLDENIDEWVLPEEVAEAMLSCVEDQDIGGGYVMEVLKGKRRNVETRNDPGPQGPGSTVANRFALRDEAFGLLAEPGWGVPK